MRVLSARGVPAKAQDCQLSSGAFGHLDWPSWFTQSLVIVLSRWPTLSVAFGHLEYDEAIPLKHALPGRAFYMNSFGDTHTPSLNPFMQTRQGSRAPRPTSWRS